MILTVKVVQRCVVRVELVAFLLLYDDVGQMKNEDNTVRCMYGRANGYEDVGERYSALGKLLELRLSRET
jgi:hypothetical protein